MTSTDLRNRRKALGLSQAALAQQLGTTKNTVARWERGEMTIARPEMLELALRQIEREREERTVKRINSWPIDEGQYATFGPDDFERYWLHGADRSDKLSDADIEEMVENCLYIAEFERREMTQTLVELRREAREWAGEWNENAESDDEERTMNRTTSAYYSVETAKLDQVVDIVATHITADDLDQRTRDFVLADWPEGEEHQNWLDSVSVAEIADWVIAGQ